VESTDEAKPQDAADQRPPRPRRGDELELRIDSLAQGGRGVARTDTGFVLFVAGGLPGDVVRARVGKSKKSHAEATAIELIEAAPERIPDTCMHGSEPCSGSPWQGLPYELQLEHKAAQVAEALRRLGGFDDIEPEAIVPAVEQWRYRNKTEYSFGADRDAPAGVALGFHARGRWDRVIDIDDCKLASERNNAARNEIRAWAREHVIPAYDRVSGLGVARNLVVREGRRTGQIHTRLVTGPGSIPKPPTDLHTVVDQDSGGTDGPTGVIGEERLREQLAGLDFDVSATAFLQTNTETAELLYGIAREYAGLAGDERLYDLFCGVGTIGLSMAADAGEVWGIEIVADAIADAEHNAELNGIENARFHAADARLGIRPLVEEAGKPDVVVIDPPRAGLSAKIVRRVLECDAKRIVYVSCNPTTLAPNARQMVDDGGYRLTKVRPVDMFPQTPHIECVALLEKE
jgi:23S rRNA (uracil1939-C5)-methyltransferase